MAMKFKAPFFYCLILIVGMALSIARPAVAASGLFPKMPPAPKAYVVNITKNVGDSKDTVYALQGLINQTSAQVFILDGPFDMQELKYSGKPFEILNTFKGDDSGLMDLFQKYQGQVKKLFVYDPANTWTWCLALMLGAQQQGIAVSEAVKDDLISKFGWKGDIVDLRSKWANDIAAYDWALANLMPNCNKQVVFTPRMEYRMSDYVVASKGFAFWLDFKDPADQKEINKIFSTPGYGVGTSLMGYASDGDDANEIANPYGIGYVVTGFNANGSFWSSFPNKTYPQQAPGKAVKAEPGKVYVSFGWSDGCNISFDQLSIYKLWLNKDRGSVPVGTPLSPTLQELTPPLLNWYYSQMTANDELECAVSGIQYIFPKNYNNKMFQAFCRLTQKWCSDAGFHDIGFDLSGLSKEKYNTFMRICGSDGIFSGPQTTQQGSGIFIPQIHAGHEEDLYENCIKFGQPNPQKPVFVSFDCTVARFNQEGGYSAIKSVVVRLEAAYPGRYVFLLPKDQFATMRAYYHLKAN
jgi:GxGYxY sequence motif in domain of unknown function N-terminal/GxGYxYP putative glycoside hydrolase C-terminal domain